MCNCDQTGHQGREEERDTGGIALCPARGNDAVGKELRNGHNHDRDQPAQPPVVRKMQSNGRH